MTRQTEHHDWTIPTEGETENWDEVLNDFFETALDREVVLAAPDSARPVAGDESPVLFFATDSVRLDFNDGEDWIEDVASPSGSGGGVTSHDDLDDVDANDHHSKTNSATELSDVSADSESDAHHAKTQPSDVDSTNWDDYEIQKDGTDGTGVINFKTS